MFQIVIYFHRKKKKQNRPLQSWLEMKKVQVRGREEGIFTEKENFDETRDVNPLGDIEFASLRPRSRGPCYTFAC